jgi:hypothetical protein
MSSFTGTLTSVTPLSDDVPDLPRCMRVNPSRALRNRDQRRSDQGVE